MTKKKEKMYDKGQPTVFDAVAEELGLTEDDLIDMKAANYRATNPSSDEELLEKLEKQLEKAQSKVTRIEIQIGLVKSRIEAVDSDLEN